MPSAPQVSRPASPTRPPATGSVLREVRGFDPRAADAAVDAACGWPRSGVRTVSLAVDVTNYLMLELGQPLHAFDRSKLHGPIVVRRAGPGETLETLDHVTRTLYRDDILITDEDGPISMAGTMGGLATEIDENSTDIVVEGAHFNAVGTAKMSRRHKLHSEASYRFERGVDRELPLAATARAAALLASLGGATVVPGCTHAQVPVTPVTISMAADYPDRVAGVVYGLDTVVRRLTEVGCEVRTGSAPAVPTIAPWRASGGTAETGHHGEHERLYTVLEVTPPSWRSDLTDAADLAEEVIRLEGYVNVPVRLPRALAGHGLTARQRLVRGIGGTLAGTGFVEVHTDPFAPQAERTTSCSRRKQAPACREGREPAQRGPAEPADNPAARPLPHPGAEHRPRFPRHRPLRDGRGVPAPARLARSRADPRHGPWPYRFRVGFRGGGPARPAGLDRRGARRQPRAAGLVGSGADGELGERGRGSPVRGVCVPYDVRRAGGAGAAVASRPVRGAVRARRHRLQAGDEHTWLAGHAGELHPPGRRRLSALRRGRAPSSWTSRSSPRPRRRPGRCAGRRCRRTRWPRRTWRWSSPLLCRRRTWPRRWRRPPGTCSRTCACSTSTPAPSSARTASRSPSRCASAPPTGRSPWRRRRRRGTRRWLRPDAWSAPYLGCYIRNGGWFLLRPTKRAAALAGAPPVSVVSTFQACQLFRPSQWSACRPPFAGGISVSSTVTGQQPCATSERHLDA